MVKEQKKPNETIFTLLLATGVVSASYFLIQLLVLLQNYRLYGVVASYATCTYATVLGSCVALIVFTKSRNQVKRYMALCILTIFVFGSLLLLFGTTSAGESLGSYGPSAPNDDDLIAPCLSCGVVN